MKDFFISYNNDDCAWAEWIAWQLEDHGYSTVLQAWDFLPGANFVLEMQNALVKARRLIAVLSPAYLKTFYTQAEIAAAFARDPSGKRQTLVPVRIKECELKGLWSQVIYIDLVGLDETQATESLINGVIKKRAKPVTAPRYPKSSHAVISRPSSFPGNLPCISNVPLLRNPNFVGRDALLADLRHTLVSEQTAVLTAIVGLGGVGKTQLALEYCYRHMADYEIVWWVRSEVKTSLATDYANLAGELQLPESTAKNNRRIVSAVKRHLQHSNNWLLIFDNAQNPSYIGDYLPRTTAGHVLITSRDPNWGGVAQSLTVPVLDKADSISYLIKRTRQGNEPAADDLASELGHLPLALAQAAAYIEQTGKSVTAYLELFRLEQWEMLRRGGVMSKDQTTVATTWEICFKRLRQIDSAAASILNLFAFLAPDQIPLALIKMDGANLTEPLAALKRNPFRLDEAIAALKSYSLIDVRDELVSVHRLVQAVVRGRLEENEKAEWANTAVCLLANSFPSDSEYVNWPESASLLPHALLSTEYAQAMGVSEECTFRLLTKVGAYLCEIGQYNEAHIVHERAMKIAARIFNSQDGRLAICYNNLGLVLLKMGRFSDARISFERALQVTQKSVYRNDLTVATRLNNLGAALFELGERKKGLAAVRRAFKIRKSILGEHDPTVANSLRNIGVCLWTKGNLKEGYHYLERALEIDRNIGGQNQDLVSDLNFLGRILLDIGDLKGARKYLDESLEMSESIYGPNHPVVANCLCVLGGLSGTLEDFGQARIYLDRALRILESTSGSTSPDRADCLLELGNLMEKSADDLEGSCAYFGEALEIYEQTYGVDNDRTAPAHNELGRILHKLGDLAGARAHLERALRIVESTYGANHYTTSIYLKNLGLLLRDLGDPDGARTHLEKAINIRERNYCSDHPKMAECLSILGSVLIDTDEFRQASVYLRRALAISLSALGENHSRTLYVKSELDRLQSLRTKRGDR